AEWRAPLDFGTDAQLETAELASEAGIATWICGQLAAKLGIDAAAIDVDSSITRYGVDSLMAVELTHSIETQLCVLLPISEFISSQSIAQIAARCFELVELVHATVVPPATAGGTDPIQVQPVTFIESQNPTQIAARSVELVQNESGTAVGSRSVPPAVAGGSI